MGPQPISAGEPPAVSRFDLRVTTPPPRSSRQADGFATIEIEGFATRQRRLGAPDIPTKTLLIAIPAGAVPRLEVAVEGELRRPGLVPRPVPRRVPTDAPGESATRFEKSGGKQFESPRRVEHRELHDPDPEVYEGARPFPRRVAWLGKTGTLRRQRYVELHLAPVRYDPATRGLLVHEALKVTVHFDGAWSANPDPVAEAAFERIYRNAFANYEQGRSFRLDGPAESGAVAPVPGGDGPSAGRGVPDPRQRILVDTTGIVRLDHARLAATDFVTHNISTWRLTNRGVAVPLQIQDDGDDLLEPNEWVQFYGQALDDDPKTELNTDFPNTEFDLYEARDFSDVNTYFLTVDVAQPAMAEQDATPDPMSMLTPPADFEALSRLEVDNVFLPLGGADPWYWTPVLNANGGTPSREVTVGLPGLASGTADAQVRVQLRGFTNFAGSDPVVDQTHLPRATLLNSTADVLAFDDGVFMGRAVHLHDFGWTYPGSGPQLSDPATVRLELFPVMGITLNEGILDWVEVRYRRSFSAAGELLTFDWPDEAAEFVVDGLSDASAEIYEITPAAGSPVVQPLRLTGAEFSCSGSCSVRFRIDDLGGTTRRFIVFGDTVPQVPGDPEFSPDTVSDLRLNTHQADLVVIGHPDVLDQTPGGPLAQLLALRATPQGGELTSKVVLVEDVEDEFNDGLPGPLAIKEFLRWVTSTTPGEGWADPKPTHVMLIGDASFNYKGGTAAGNFLSTQVMFKDTLELGYYASDTRMADVAGDDQLADLLVGRIPARTAAEANQILQKTLDYEQSTLGGSWRENALFISDRGKTGFNPAEALGFENVNDTAASYMAAPYTSQRLRYWTDYYNNPDYLNDPNQPPLPQDGIRRDIKAALNGPDCMSGGAAMTQYDGHGNAVVWSDDAFMDERPNPPDSADLCNAERLTWLLALNCLTGAFHVPSLKTVGEDWLKLPGGGAVAVFSPGGLSFTHHSRTVTEVVWDDVFGPRKERAVGVTVMNSLVRLCTNGSIEACQNHVYLGDPALQLAVRSVAPATDVQATAGNAQVDLSWTASTTPGATYDVYRSGTLVNPTYTKRNGTPLSGTAFSDTNLVNAWTYYYFVIATDPDAFVSRQSNFNTDCSTDGPDCVKATPLNPNPPNVPANVTLEDPGLGTALILSWDDPVENDLSYYTVQWGTQSGSYTDQATVSPVTTYTLSGLVEGQVYFVVVSVTNTSGLTSAPSGEVDDFPVLALGLRAPRFIVDLTVAPSNDDIQLTWGEVTTDIFGKPKAVFKYQIFRGTSPNFDNQQFGAPLAECFSPCTGHLDSGAMLAADSYHYRVRAVDVEGTAGGLGAELPAYTTLGVDRAVSPAGEIVLSWTPVLTRVDGSPMDLLYYEIYAADAPFGRADIRDGSVPLLVTEPGTLLQLAPPAQDRYYSVLAVDRQRNRSQF